MDNLRNAIEILFRKQNPEILLRDHCVWRNLVTEVDKDYFIDTYIAMNPPFTGNQTELVYSLLKEEWMKGQGKASVFHVLLAYGMQVLLVKEGMPVCRYEHYLRWHEMTTSVGEDIFTCSFLAQDDLKTRTQRKSFAWKTVLESDNSHLDALFRRGLSELHCHLNGSSMNFDLNWLAIMNEPEYQKREWFNKAPGHKTMLYELSLFASFIRMHLFEKINGYISGTDFDDIYNNLIKDKDRLLKIPMYITTLQSEIACQSELHAKKFDGSVIDYAIPKSLSIYDGRHQETQLLVGERKLMYECFRQVLSGDHTFPEFGFAFYTYLVIKSHVRDLIIHNNKVKGFANFKMFDKNKDLFVEHSRNRTLQRLIPKLAIASYNEDTRINYFEYRIATKKSASAMNARLKTLSTILGENGHARCIFHFIKYPDNEKYFADEIANQFYCRNFHARIEYSIQARALKLLLQRFDDRIVGIDAANSEFGCRPEVFAEIYRSLQHLERDTSFEIVREIKWQDLGVTYHVGEDFYDIVDGLRAIEEAILFLNLTDGARLGHAVALGIGAKEYYAGRKNTIIIPKQDLLDNCVWILSKMDEFSIHDDIGVRNQLILDVQRLLNDIYSCPAIADYRVYHQSWLLRGDKPSLYMNATLETMAPEDILEDPYSLNHFDKRIDIARAQKYARVLYRQYHYDSKVKHRGHQPEEWKIPEGVIRVIEEIQKQMRNDVARRKIAIEVNPTSNLRICNIDTYDTHPVVKFRNFGLSFMNETNDCPQISVSINTDDKGIFATSLEKEYTLMALALEKQKAPDGKPMYHPNNILNWLEGLRLETEIQRFDKA